MTVGGALRGRQSSASKEGVPKTVSISSHFPFLAYYFGKCDKKDLRLLGINVWYKYFGDSSGVEHPSFLVKWLHVNLLDFAERLDDLFWFHSLS